MLDATAREGSEGSPAPRAGLVGTRRRRALVACAVLALIAHGLFIGEIGGPSIGTAEPPASSVSLRTIAAAAEEPAVETAASPAEAVVPDAPMPPQAAPAPSRAPSRGRSRSSAASAPIERAGASSEVVSSAPPADVATGAPAAASGPAASEVPEIAAPTVAAGPLVAEAPSASPASGPVAETLDSDARPPGTPLPPLLAQGELPPPVYKTRLPPSATLRYQVRRGFLRGTGEIRWQSAGDTYRLVLEARIAGLTLLRQTSEGAIDTTGLAPMRFVDQRARRPAQAANFRRDAGTVTFSGPAVEWPLLAGSQDRLSWMIQLAGIAAADPGLLVEGGRIAMVVVGARGEASVWTLRYAGREDVDTAWGTVHAVKLVRDGRSAYDTSAEIWLDPARDYLPAHATLRNSSGASEYDLLLERVEPAS